MRFSPDKRSLAGAILWISSIHYFITQLVVIAAWTVPHSMANNYISDLGNTECGDYAGLAVCSPLWPVMNLSFVVYGVTMAVGAMLLYRRFNTARLSGAGFSLMILSGIGTMMVGLFPENTIGQLHATGAFLGLGVGNLSVLLLGLSLTPLGRNMRTYTIASALLSLTAFILFANDIYLGLGRGGMERLISYPFTVWMIAFGIYVFILDREKPRRAFRR